MASDLKFEHYLAYTSTDQETFRELRDKYDGVVVPATFAAWQRQGTGGFVLSLSATEQAIPYVIDPRFPLFQQALRNPKQSHRSLAQLLGDETLIAGTEPQPADFTDERLRQLAEAWVAFNRGYEKSSNDKFDKYARRLHEPAPTQDRAQGPRAILAPYFVAESVDDPWWDLSKRLFELTAAAAANYDCLRVVAAESSVGLETLLGDVPGGEDVVIWVSGLDEHSTSARELADYRLAIGAAKAPGRRVFALYGGFFSVLLSAAGLGGSSHGVGFSEHREWRELTRSGAPPARYYGRRFHRYLSVDMAERLWRLDRSLVECPCPHCEGRSPLQLPYHELMKHSVWCRAEEIDHFAFTPLATAAELLRSEHAALVAQIEQLELLPQMRKSALGRAGHLSVWAESLSLD